MAGSGRLASRYVYIWCRRWVAGLAFSDLADFFKVFSRRGISGILRPRSPTARFGYRNISGNMAPIQTKLRPKSILLITAVPLLCSYWPGLIYKGRYFT